MKNTSFYCKLASLQRTVCLGITGAMSTTSGASFVALLNLYPWYMYIQITVMQAVQVQIEMRVTEQEKLNPVFVIVSDSRIPIHLFGKKYKTIAKSREN